MLELRPYQIEDVEFLSQFNSMACFNEQRTGKTPTALKIIEKKNLKKAIIIVPSSAIYPWAEAYETWLGLPCIPLVGTQSKRMKLLENWEHGLVMSYDTLKITKNSDGMIQEIASLKPEIMILDEAHRIKSRTSARTDAILAFRNLPNKLSLTGTPAPGKPQDIFPILQWHFPEIFTSYWKFIDEYFYKTKKPGKYGVYIEIIGFKPGKEIILQELLATFSTMRKRTDVMPWLPKKEPPTKIKLPQTREQEKYLTELLNYYETEHIITKGTLDRLIRYRQICLDPTLIDLKGSSPKTDWIKLYLSDYPEENIIIFSKFTSYLKKLYIDLKEITPTGILIGETPLINRKMQVDQFQARKLRVLLLNIDVGKENLTLDTAETMIFTDKYPPIGDIEQAEARFVATTQEKALKPNKIFELMIKGTYDEQLYSLLELRKSETDILNNYKYYIEERRKQHDATR